jgi:hypothetical protein
MAYVIQREDGKYVAVHGSQHSYTSKLERAQIYDTREAADRDRCDNERAVEVTSYGGATMRRFASFFALALLLSGSTLYAADTTAAPKPRSKPSAQITVKVHPDKFQGKKERLILRPVSTHGHCTAWIAADEDALWISALDSCRALLRKGGAK